MVFQSPEKETARRAVCFPQTPGCEECRAGSAPGRKLSLLSKGDIGPLAAWLRLGRDFDFIMLQNVVDPGTDFFRQRLKLIVRGDGLAINDYPVVFFGLYGLFAIMIGDRYRQTIMRISNDTRAMRFLRSVRPWTGLRLVLTARGWRCGIFVITVRG